MGCYGGDEVCELIGMNILAKPPEVLNRKDTGLYRDNGLSLLGNVTGRTADHVRKIMIKLF